MHINYRVIVQLFMFRLTNNAYFVHLLILRNLNTHQNLVKYEIFYIMSSIYRRTRQQPCPTIFFVAVRTNIRNKESKNRNRSESKSISHENSHVIYTCGRIFHQSIVKVKIIKKESTKNFEIYSQVINELTFLYSSKFIHLIHCLYYFSLNKFT